MNTQTAASCIAIARPALSLRSARLGDLPPVALRMTAADVTAVTAYASHAQKRFAMAGTDINVWPLGPQEWTSG